MSSNPFVPKFDVKQLIGQFKEVKKPEGKAKGPGKQKEESSRVSNISGFPTMRSLHNYFFATVVPNMAGDDPNAPFQLQSLIEDQMNKEYPYAKNTTGVDEHKTPVLRVDNAGKPMMDANGKPISRGYNNKHYRRYFTDAFENGIWGDIAYFGLTEEQIDAAKAVYEQWKENNIVVIKKRGEE